jgi:hypothetical protein
MHARRTGFLLFALAALAALAASGCGKSNPTSPPPLVGTLTDFEHAVYAAYPSGAVIPTTLSQYGSLLATVDVAGVDAALALFQSGGIFVDAGRVSLVHAGAINAFQVDTLARRTVLVSSVPWNYYSTVPDLPRTPPLTFDGAQHHVFHVAGSASFAAYDDSITSVAIPAVTAPAASANVPRSADLTVTWSDAGADSTVYVLCGLRSSSDTSKVVLSVLVRDSDGSATIPTARLATLPAGSARLSTARFRVLRRDGPPLMQLLCEATELRNVTMQ